MHQSKVKLKQSQITFDTHWKLLYFVKTGESKKKKGSSKTIHHTFKNGLFYNQSNIPRRHVTSGYILLPCGDVRWNHLKMWTGTYIRDQWTQVSLDAIKAFSVLGKQSSL